MHDVYVHRHHPHPHVHHHHHHGPGSQRDARYGSLLLPSVRAARIGPAPPGDAAKADPAAVAGATSAWAGAFHGTVDIVPSFGFDTAGNWVPDGCMGLSLGARV
ncbi:hypothetical protein DV515_00006585 [Chloebia gouldiae]|uniref:Uncharacterized protein n=1 Tax=Chloebia gouldiae TaxID=44316 RepID=A0A3L8SKT0_CHLGU|nr:hypothetical protein DV515_00006585 [Chloebia gouldiae]